MFYVFKTYTVNSRCSAISLNKPIGMFKDILSADFVIKRIEPIGGFLLGFQVELPLKCPDIIWSY